MQLRIKLPHMLTWARPVKGAVTEEQTCSKCILKGHNICYESKWDIRQYFEMCLISFWF